MAGEMRQALTERRDLIEARAAAILDTAIGNSEGWTTALGTKPTDDRMAAAWRSAARTVAAYRDRYQIGGAAPLGAPPETDAQKIDAARAGAAFNRARRPTTSQAQQPEPTRRSGQERTGPRL